LHSTIKGRKSKEKNHKQQYLKSSSEKDREFFQGGFKNKEEE
jgi:hypothetical protein